MKQYLIKFFYLSFLSTAIIIGAKSFDSKKLLSFLEAKIQNENKNTEINQNNASLALEEKSNNGTSVPFHNFKVTDTNYSEKKRKNQKQITINTRSSRDETSKNNSPKRINSNSLEREGIQDNKRYVASENERSKSTQDEKNNNKDNKLLVDDSTNNGNTDISTQEDATQYSDQTDQSSPDATNFEQGNNGIAINQNSQTQPNTNNTNAATTPATTANSPVNNSSSQPLTPKLKGIVYPLKNLSITYENKKLRIPELLLRSSFASSCSAIASIHEIDHATATPELIPITSSAIKPDATFDLSIDENVIDTENPSKYVLKINGCSSSYSRIITSFFTEQDVSIGTTLLMKVIEVSTPKKITTNASKKLT